MDRVPLGKTGLEVSRLGVGLAEIGYELSRAEVDQAGEVLNAALDSGINFLDTAACYSISEELIGKTVSHRRDEFVLATKAGHVTDGYSGEAWSYQTVADSVDRSLKRLNTDHLDLVQLHSCGIDVLEQGDCIRALQDAKAAGKLRHVCYSGDNEDAHWAVDSGLFDTLQTSFNLTEQAALTSGLFEKSGKARHGDHHQAANRRRNLGTSTPVVSRPHVAMTMSTCVEPRRWLPTASYPENRMIPFCLPLVSRSRNLR